jgi:hypothetical protein
MIQYDTVLIQIMIKNWKDASPISLFWRQPPFLFFFSLSRALFSELSVPGSLSATDEIGDVMRHNDLAAAIKYDESQSTLDGRNNQGRQF